MELGPIISGTTLVPISVAIAAALLIWRISAKFTQVMNRLDSIEGKLDDHWTRADQLEWILQMRDANPTMRVPLPRHYHGTENIP